MSDVTPSGHPRHSILAQDRRTRRRNAAERPFRYYGLGAVVIGLLALAMLLSSILMNGLSSFQQTYIQLEVPLSAEVFDPAGIAIPTTSPA